MRLVFLGPPGAGKGTQASRFAEQQDIPHISTGDILRRAIELATPTGVEAKEYVDKGELVPFDVILRLVRDRLREPDAEKGWILDGFPRNLEQAHAFEKLLGEMQIETDRVVYFDVGSDAVVARLSGRRTCRQCGAVFHIQFSPPKVAGICDQCGSEDLYQRTDDQEEAIRNRLQVYSDETQPLVEFYKAKGLMLTLAAEASMEDVARDLAAGLT